MNSLSFIHSGSSANVMVFLETGLEKDTGASESSSARRERETCRWWRGTDKVMMGVEQELTALTSDETEVNAQKRSRLGWPAMAGKFLTCQNYDCLRDHHREWARVRLKQFVSPAHSF